MVLAGLALIRFAPFRADLYIQFSYAVLIILGMVAVLPKLSELTARALRPLMDRLFGAEGALAVDSMIQAPRRTSATVGALMIGLMFVFATGAYVESQKNVFDRWMKQTINADLVVTTTEGARSRTWHFDESLSGKIAALPGVKRLENVRFTFLPYSDDSVALVALELDGWFARAKLEIQGASAATAREKYDQRRRHHGRAQFRQPLRPVGRRPYQVANADRTVRPPHRRRHRRLYLREGHDLHGARSLQTLLERPGDRHHQRQSDSGCRACRVQRRTAARDQGAATRVHLHSGGVARRGC